MTPGEKSRGMRMNGKRFVGEFTREQSRIMPGKSSGRGCGVLARRTSGTMITRSNSAQRAGSSSDTNTPSVTAPKGKEDVKRIKSRFMVVQN